MKYHAECPTKSDIDTWTPLSHFKIISNGNISFQSKELNALIVHNYYIKIYSTKPNQISKEIATIPYASDIDYTNIVLVKKRIQTYLNFL